jgi:8-oxo-dGTP diphosphatase
MSPLTWAVAAVIEDPVGRVLLCQQSHGQRLWGLPGGKVRHGESPVRAAIRDIREEIGRDVEIANLLGLYHLTGDGCGEDLPDVLVHVFRARLDGETTVNSPGRIRRLAWHDPSELPDPMTAVTRTALGDAGKGHAGVLRNVTRDVVPVLPEDLAGTTGDATGLVTSTVLH